MWKQRPDENSVKKISLEKDKCQSLPIRVSFLWAEDGKMKVDFDINGTTQEKRFKESCSTLEKSKDTLEKKKKEEKEKKM